MGIGFGPHGSRGAAGIAHIDAIGNIGGFIGTELLGFIEDGTGSYPLGLLLLVDLSEMGRLLVLGLGGGRKQSVQVTRA